MKRPLAMVALATAIVMMGWLMWYDTVPTQDSGENNPGALRQGEAVTLTGCVYDIQERDSYGTGQLWIYLDSITIQKQNASLEEADVSYHMICQTDREYRPKMGSRIRVTGQFEQFSNATNPGQFDAQTYYTSIGVEGLLKKAEIIAVSGRYSVVKEALYCLRQYWKEKLYRCFPEKEASVLSAMLLGDKTQLDEGTKELYMQNGIIHILSISGLHITLIGMGIYRLLRRGGCGISVSAVAGGLILVLYGIMTGMGVSAVRAIGMYLIRMLGELLGRTYDMLTALGCMGLLMLAGRPEYLKHVGFLLSFGSLCGIGAILPGLVGEEENRGGRRRYREPGVTGEFVKDMLAMAVKRLKKEALPGIAVTLTTLPIQLYYYYEVPVYSILLNLLILPFMGAVMVVGMIVMVIPGMFWLGKLDVLILGGYEWLCEVFEKLPHHTWNPGAPQVWQIVVYYLLLSAGVLWCREGKNSLRKKRVRVLAVFGAVILLGWRIQPKLSVTFLDVGQGDGICVRTEKETYLFDCGSSSEGKIGEYVLVPYLKHEGIRHLNAVFVSHPDKDHISGILELLAMSREERITIERLVLPDIAEENRGDEFADILAAVEDMGETKPEVIYMGEGAFWQSGEVKFACLHPPAQSDITDSNAYSQCFLVEYGDFTMLLTGDAQAEGEQMLVQELLDRRVEKVDLLKVAHHGSGNSTKEELLGILQPVVAVISCGENNSYGHPHEELIERLHKAECRIYQTPDTGAITVTVGRKGMSVRCFK